MSQKMLNAGDVEYLEEKPPSEIEMLRDDVESMRSEISELRGEVNTVKMILLRQYSAYKQSFGDAPVVSSTDSADKWAAIKQRLAPRMRDAVDILLLQGSMTRRQLASAMKMNYTNCATNIIAVLIRQGWMVDSSGKLSLKEL